MSEELAEYKSGDITANETGGLVPRTFNGLWRISRIMASSGLMPKGIEKPEAVFVCVQMGLEVGLSPMQAVQNIAPINGRPTIWGDAMLGLVRGSGMLEEIKEKAVGTFPNDNYAAVCTVKRKGYDAVVQTFSIADAKKAGLWNKSGPWQQYPKRMLQMRARSWALRDAFGDVLKGLQCAEEVMDYDVDMQRGPGGAYEYNQPETAADEPEQAELSESVKIGNDFKAAVEAREHDPEKVERFVEATANANNKSVLDVKKQALQHQDRFFASYEKFENGNGDSGKANGHNKQQDPEAAFRNEWINLRAAGYSTYVWKNLERFKKASPYTQKEAEEKWQKLYPETTWPLDEVSGEPEKKQQEPEESAPGPGDGPEEDPAEMQDPTTEPPPWQEDAPEPATKSVFQQWDEIQQTDEAGAGMALEAAGFDNEPGNEADLKKCVDAYYEILNQGQQAEPEEKF